MLRKLGQSGFSVKTCNQHPAQIAKYTLLRWGLEPGFLLLITAPLQCVMLAAQGLGQMEGVRSRVSRCLPEMFPQGELFWLRRALLREGLIVPLTFS